MTELTARDANKENLLDRIDELEERLQRLETTALTSQNIAANKGVFGVHPIDNASDGSLVVAGSSGLPYYNSDGEIITAGVGDVLAGDAVAAVVFRGASTDAGTEQTVDQSDLYSRVEGTNHNAWNWHFDKDELPPNMTFQTYSPFATTTLGTSLSNGYLTTLDIGASGGRKFLAQTITDISHMYILNPWTRSGSSGGVNVGLRLDDASDNNYYVLEWRFNYDGSSPAQPNWWVRRRYRAGGGAVTSEQITGKYMRQAHLLLRLSVEGTKWSNWTARPFLYEPGGFKLTWLAALGGLSWQPTRFGIEWYNETSTAVNWQYVGLDAFRYTV